MEKYLFVKQLSGLIEKEDFVKRVFSVYLKSIAIFTILAGLVGFVVSWKDVLKLSTTGLIGGIIFQTLFIIAVYSVVHSLLLGAENIKENKEADPIFTHTGCEILKSFSLAYGLFASIMAIGGGIFIWFAGAGVRNTNSLFRVLNHYYPFTNLQGEVFIQGLSFMIRGIAYAFLISLGLYILSEVLTAVVRLHRSENRSR